MQRLTLFFLLYLCACGQPASGPEKKWDQLAEGYCTCFQELLSLNKTALENPEKADFKAMQSAYEKTDLCVKNLHQRFGKPNAEDQAAFVKSLREKCPAFSGIGGEQSSLIEELLK